MPRLFTGIEIPDEQRQELARLRMPLPGAKWVDAENLHITLRFAGDIDNAVAAEFADALAAIDVGTFSLKLAGLGAFGGNSPHALWAGVEAEPELDTLARANERAARAAGLAPNGRAFKAHVTLARLRQSRAEPVARFLGRYGAFRSRPFVVSRFVLFSARPQSGGGPYVVEKSYPLNGGDEGLADMDGGW